MPKVNNTKYYKFLNLRDGEIVSEHGNQTWQIGKKYSVRGKVVQCSNGFHASALPLDALGYVKGDVLAVVSVAGQSDNDDDKVCYRSMTIERAYRWTKVDSVAMAIFAAELVIQHYEGVYPDDDRPRTAIEAARAYLKQPQSKTRAAYAAYAAAAAAAAAAYAAAAADAAADAAYAAAHAAAHFELRQKVNDWMIQRINQLEEIK